MLTVDRGKSRHYGDEAGRYFSVSQVCEVLSGGNGYANQAAMQRGTDVHLLFALTLGAYAGHCAMPEIPEEYGGYHAAILQWITDWTPKPTMLEETLKHQTLGYAGTLDFAGLVGQDFGVLDLKTGAPARWHSVQVCAYQKMLGRAAKQWLLYLDPEGTYKQVAVKPSARDWAAFQNALSVLQWREA